MTRSSTSPRPARWLLEHALPAEDREAVSGDLEEVFQRDCRTDGLLQARLRYWQKSVSFSRHFVVERWRERRRQRPASFSLAGGDMKFSGKELVYAARSLRKSPTFTLAALAILTLGIGANSAVFSIVNSVLLNPLPFPDSDSVVTVLHVPPKESFPGLTTFPVSPANYIDWRNQNTVFESMAAINGRNMRLGGSGRPQSIVVTTTVPDFFRVLRARPAVGRTFTAEESQPGRDDVLVLSHGFAERQFGSPQTAVGRRLALSTGGTSGMSPNERHYRVVGVMPPEFDVKSWFPASTEAWMPLARTAEDAAVRDNHNDLVVARLRPGVTVTEAQSQMNVISERLARQYPNENTGWGAVVTRLRDDLVGDVRPALLTLLGAVGFVLLIACANTANLVLARTITRRKELAIRAALGASAGQVIRPVLVETMLLAVAGGALGLLVAQSGQSLILEALADQMPRATEVQLDVRVLGFTLLASIFTGLAAGLIASWRLARVDLNKSLKQGSGRTDTVSGGAWTRNVLVVAEVALSLVLLVGAGLMVRSLLALYRVDLGFVPSNLMTMTVPIPESAEETQRNRFYDEFLPRVRRLPEVTAAAAISNLPVDGRGSQQPIVIEGRPAEVFALQPTVAVRTATPGYFQTMGIPLLAGRDFEEVDTEADGKAAIVISQSLARQFWPGQSPIGKRLSLSFSADIVREVVGVVGDVKERGIDVLEPVAMLYEPLKQDADGNISLVVRGGDGPAVVPAITRVLHQINPELPVRDARAMDERVAESLSQHRFSMYLFVALGALGCVLAAVGIYSVLAYSIRSRVQEIGIRMALGAQVLDVLRLVVIEGMKPTLVGIIVGAFGAWTLSGILARVIFGVSAVDPYTFAAVALLLASVALMACLIPAYRATRVEPVTALRNE